MPSSNMLLPSRILLIDMTFSTPTGDYANNPMEGDGGCCQPPLQPELCLIKSRYQRNGSSGKQVDSHFGRMAVSWGMANIGVAPALAPNRIVLGPLSTQGGFQYWYLACFPDCIVALRQGIGAFFVLGMSNDDGVSYPASFGLVGVLVNHLLKPQARAYRQRMEAMVQNSPTSRLRTKPKVVYEVTQLKAIQ